MLQECETSQVEETPENSPYGEWMRAGFGSNRCEGKWGPVHRMGRSQIGEFVPTTTTKTNLMVAPIISFATQIIDDMVLVSNSNVNSQSLQVARKGGNSNSPVDVMEQPIVTENQEGDKDTVYVEDGTKEEGTKPLVGESSTFLEGDMVGLFEVPVHRCMDADLGHQPLGPVAPCGLDVIQTISSRPILASKKAYIQKYSHQSGS